MSRYTSLVMIAYTVACEFDDPAVAGEWIAWLRDAHLAEVCAAGALDAEVIRMDSPRDSTTGLVSGANTTNVEVRYHFASREAFQRYERDHAPRLRAEGLKRFPLERGVAYSRSLGEIVAAQRAAAP